MAEQQAAQQQAALSVLLEEVALADEERECRYEAEAIVDEVFFENAGRNFNTVTNASVLYNYQSALAYEDGCEARCASCRMRASYVNAVQNSVGRRLTIPGTAQDAFLFFAVALLVGLLCAAQWRWVGPRTRRFTAWLRAVPETILVLVAGGALFCLAHYVNLKQFSNSFSWWLNANPPELLFYALLPVLLFNAAMRVKWYYFRTSLFTIMIFAFLMVVLNTMLTGLLLQYTVVKVGTTIGVNALGGWNLYHGFTLGAILSSTDPVAVISFMEENNAPAMLATVIEGESLFNDATAYILFQAFLQSAMLGLPAKPPADIVAEVAYAGSVGVGVGLTCGLILVVIVRSLHEQRTLETNFTLAMAYLSFYLAQGVLNASGPVAVTTCGLFMASSGLAAVSPNARNHLLAFWDCVCFISNTVIFFYSGALAMAMLTSEGLVASDTVLAQQGRQDLEGQGESDANVTQFVGTVILGMPVIYVSQYLLRGLWIALMYPFMGHLGFAEEDRSPGTAIFLTSSALRGGVNLIMALIVAQMPSKEIPIGVKFFLTIWAVAFVLLTLLINAPMIPWIMRVTNVGGGSSAGLTLARKALGKFTLEAVKTLERERSLLSCDIAAILRAIEGIFDLGGARPSQGREGEGEGRHGCAPVAAGPAAERKEEEEEGRENLPRIWSRMGPHGTEWLFHERERGKGEPQVRLMRRSYELTRRSIPIGENGIPRHFQRLRSNVDSLEEYSHMIITMKCAGINTLASALLEKDGDDEEEQWDQGKFTRRSNRDLQEELMPQSSLAKNLAKFESEGREATREEARVKWVHGMARQFRQQRQQGKVSPAELFALSEACDRATHTSAKPIRLWYSWESKWLRSMERRRKLFNASLKLGKVGSFLYKSWLRRFSSVQQNSCSVAMTFVEAARMSVGWVHYPWLEAEVNEALALAEDFIFQLNLDEPELVSRVSTYRAGRQLAYLLSEYVEQLQLSGLIEEHEVEALEKPIRRAREALNLEMPYFPTLYNAILSNFSFSKVLPPGQYKELVLGPLRFTTVAKGGEIRLRGEGLSIVLQGIVQQQQQHWPHQMQRLVGSGAILGLNLAMAEVEVEGEGPLQQGCTAYSSVVHLAHLSPKSIARLRQASPEAELELFRCWAAAILDRWLRCMMALDERESGGAGDDEDDDAVADQDIEEAVRKVKTAREHRSRKVAITTSMHLLNNLDYTDLCVPAEGDSVIQQGHLVLLAGSVTADAGEEVLSDERVIEFTTERTLVARERSFLICFHPVI